MNKSRGNSLPEYSIIIAIVILAIIPICLVFGQSILKAFQGYSDLWQTNPKNVAKQLTPDVAYDFSKAPPPPPPPSTPPPPPTSLGGTGEAPVIDCVGGKCEMDFGEIFLTGMPEDFNGYVETAGGSGGTHLLADALMQISQQLAADGLTEQSEKVKILSTLSHNLGFTQASVEYLAKACGNDVACYKSRTSERIADLSSINSDYFTFDHDLTYGDAISFGDLGLMQMCRKNPSFIPECTNSEFSRYNSVILDTLSSLQNDSKLTDSTKGVISQLTYDIGYIASEFSAPLNMLMGNDGYSIHDPFTGEIQYSVSSASAPDPSQSIDNYNASNLTHLDSALICASGNYQDSGKKCN